MMPPGSTCGPADWGRPIPGTTLRMVGLVILVQPCDTPGEARDGLYATAIYDGETIESYYAWNGHVADPDWTSEEGEAWTEFCRRVVREHDHHLTTGCKTPEDLAALQARARDEVSHAP